MPGILQLIVFAGQACNSHQADRQTQAVPVPALPSQPPHLTTEAELRWTFCAAQGGTCRCSGKVRWGNAGTWLEYEPAGALHCSIEALPDVIPGDTKKHCECLQPDVGVAGADKSPSAPSAPAEWRFCASQWQECRCHGTVRWGNEGQWHEVKPRPGESSVTVSCSVAQLPDVAPGDDGKHCQCSGSVAPQNQSNRDPGHAETHPQTPHLRYRGTL